MVGDLHKVNRGWYYIYVLRKVSLLLERRRVYCIMLRNKRFFLLILLMLINNGMQDVVHVTGVARKSTL